MTAFAVLFFALCVQAPRAGAEGYLALKDGRYVIGPEMVAGKEGVLVHFDHGDVLVRSELIADAVPTSWDGIDPAARTPEIEDKLRHGMVPLGGKWVSRASLQVRKKPPTSVPVTEITAVQEDRLAWENRKQRETKYFKFEYTVPDSRLDRYAEYMQLFLEHVVRTLKADLPKTERLKIRLFGCDRLMNQIVHSNVYTFDFYSFDGVNNGLHFSDEPLEEARALRMMREGLTQYALVILAPKVRYPDWIVESLADYFATSELQQSSKKFSEGKLQLDRIENIRADISAGHTQQLRDIVSTSDTFMAGEQGDWAWSFTQFVMQDSKLRPRYISFLGELGNGKGVRREDSYRDFAKVLPDEFPRLLCQELKYKDLDAIQRDWIAWIQAFEAPRTVEERLEAGRLALRRGDWVHAVEYLDKAIEGGLDTPDVLTDSGQARLMRGNPEGARSRFEAALRIDPLAAYAYLWLARVELSDRAKADKEKALRWLRLAVEIAPGDTDLALAAASTEGSLQALQAGK